MKLIGYNDTWSGKPGDLIQFMVSSEEAHFDVNIVRLFQVDERAVAPPYREQVIDADCSGRYPGRKQSLRAGSFLRVPHHELLETNSFSLTAWIYPTTVGRGRQGLFGKSTGGSHSGFDLFVSENGCLRFELGQPSGKRMAVESAQPLEKAWYFVAAAYDSSTGRALIWHKRKSVLTPHLTATVEAHSASVAADAIAPSGVDLLIGALHANDASWVTGCFNGKIASPAFHHRALSVNEIASLYDTPRIEARGLTASWDFSRYPFDIVVPDRSGNGLSAKIINNPTRAVTGPHWDGSIVHFQMKPEHYDAIYFHEDDLEDAAWSVDFTWQIPDDIPSGVYAARLRTATEEDYVPFIVRPARATAPTLFVLPTFTYQAYANDRTHAVPFLNWETIFELPLRLSPQDQFSAETPELGCSIYAGHTDGSVNSYSSLRRPVVNFRPKLVSFYNGAGRHFGADMYLVDWLDRLGFPHDMATDHDLNAEGVVLLSQYKVVLLGSHPEYFSRQMRIAFENYIAQGGRLMYLGGNGGQWVTSVDPVRPHVIEVKKPAWLEQAAPSFGVQPGEEFLSTSGQRGGSWLALGRGPESLFGVGTAAASLCQSPGYRRQPDSFDSRVRFIFEGIGAQEIIGDFGLAFGGAAGDEIDRAHINGSGPPNTFVLASSSGHSTTYSMECTGLPYKTPEEKAAAIRSDLAYYEVPGGGAVFSVGSMCWCTSLPHNDYDNNVSRLTANVLRHFLRGSDDSRPPSPGKHGSTPVGSAGHRGLPEHG